MPVLIHPSVHLFHTPRQSREEKERGKERETKKREKRMLPCLFSLPLTLLVKLDDTGLSVSYLT
jgi:hypothetical protein